MKLIGWILLACLVIAAAQAVAAVLVLGLIVVCLYRAPRETLVLAALAALVNLAALHPVAVLGVVALAVGIGLIFRAKRLDESPGRIDMRRPR